MYGTLKRLAVDDLTLVHPEQTMDLPLTEAPTEGGGEGGRSIFLLSGPRGSGKTATLYHAVHFARKSGWLVFLIPSAFEYLHEGGLVRPSPYFKGFFDTPDLAQTTLRQIGEAHGHQLAGLPLKDREVVARLGLREGGKEGGPGGATMLDLVVLGLKKKKLATTCLLELKRGMEGGQDKFPVLFAVDEFSEWFYPSTYHYAQKKIEASRLVLVAALKNLLPSLPSSPSYGKHHKHIAFLAARSERFPRLSRSKASKGSEGRKRLADLPPHPLPPSLPPYDIPHPPSYSPSEFQTLYQFIADQGLWGPNPSLEESSIRQARVATAAHPLTFARDAAAIEGRLFSPQNKVGKASAHAPVNFMLADLLDEGGEGGGERGEEVGGKEGGGGKKQQQQRA